MSGEHQTIEKKSIALVFGSKADFDESVKYIADEYVYQKARSWRDARIEKYLTEELYRDYGKFEPMF